MWVDGVGVFYAVFYGVFAVVAASNDGLVFESDESVVLSWGIDAVARLFDCHSPLLSVGFLAARIYFSADIDDMGGNVVSGKVFAYAVGGVSLCDCIEIQLGLWVLFF